MSDTTAAGLTEAESACEMYEAPGQDCMTSGMQVIAAEGLCGPCAIHLTDERDEWRDKAFNNLAACDDMEAALAHERERKETYHEQWMLAAAALQRVEARVAEWEETGPVWFDPPTDAATEIRAALESYSKEEVASSPHIDFEEPAEPLRTVRGRRVTEDDADW